MDRTIKKDFYALKSDLGNYIHHKFPFGFAQCIADNCIYCRGTAKGAGVSSEKKTDNDIEKDHQQIKFRTSLLHPLISLIK